jgi:hypothetical protein
VPWSLSIFGPRRSSPRSWTSHYFLNRFYKITVGKKACLLGEDSLLKFVLCLCLGISVHENILFDWMPMHVTKEEYVTAFKSLFHH